MLLYRPVERSTEIAWGSTRPVMSIKEVFFPPTERLLTIEKVGQQVSLTETLPEGKAVIFGVRPCDAQGPASAGCLIHRQLSPSTHTMPGGGRTRL